MIVILLGVLASYVFLIPVSNNAVLFPTLAVLGAVSLVSAWRGRAVPDRALLLVGGLWAVFLAFGIIVGVVRGAESLPRVLVFLLVWPVLFSVMTWGFRLVMVRVVFIAGALVTIAISVIFMVGAGSAVGVLPPDALPSWIVDLLAFRYIAGDTGVFALSSHSLPPLMWWSSMWLASLVIDRDDRVLPPMFLRLLAAALSVAGVLIAWRRGIVIVLILAPVIILATLVLLRVRRGATMPRPRAIAWSSLRLVSCVGAGGALALVFQPRLLELLGGIGGSVATALGLQQTVATPPKEDAVLADDAAADGLRSNEAASLVDTDSPLDLWVGRGFGATIDRGDVFRDMSPWQTELQYHLLFHWTGVIGLVLIVAVVTVALLTVRRASMVAGVYRNALLVSTVGAVALLIGNATNPYMQAPGHMWPAFLPLMIAGAVLAQRRARPPAVIVPTQEPESVQSG